MNLGELSKLIDCPERGCRAKAGHNCPTAGGKGKVHVTRRLRALGYADDRWELWCGAPHHLVEIPEQCVQRALRLVAQQS